MDRDTRRHESRSGGYGNVYVTIPPAVLTRRTLFNQRDLRKSLAPVFSRVVWIGAAEREIGTHIFSGFRLRPGFPIARSALQVGDGDNDDLVRQQTIYNLVKGKEGRAPFLTWKLHIAV